MLILFEFFYQPDYADTPVTQKTKIIMSTETAIDTFPKIKLYGYPTSPFVLKTGCHLKYKQLPFEFVPVNPITREQIKFSNQQQVPVLSIDDEWKNDSSPIGIWLDERFPEKPLLGENEAEKETIIAIDNWISKHLLPARFRAAIIWDNPWNAIRNGWVLAAAMHEAVSIPWYLRASWPLLVKRADFLKRIVNTLDLDEPLWDMHERLATELIDHMQGGPFLGGLSRPSLADFSAYPIIIFSHLMGLHGRNVYLEKAEIIKWCKNVQSHLPDNPMLVSDDFLKRDIFR